MKKNRIRVIIVIVLASFSFWFIVNNHKGTIKQTLRDFAVADTASITKIFLADKSGNAITLERKLAGHWTVNKKYDARPDAVQMLLTTIKKVDVKEPVGKQATNNVIKRLAAKAVRCEIYNGDKLVKAYYVGTETHDDTGTYMILIDLETMLPSAKPFVTYIPGFEGYLTTRYFTEEKGWRDRTVFRYNPNDIKSVKMEVPDKPNESWELTANGNNKFQVKTIGNNKTIPSMDTLAVKQYLSYFQQLNFEGFEFNINEKQIDSVKKSQPLNILTVTDKKGESKKIVFFARYPKQKGLFDKDGKEIIFDLDRMDASLNDGKDFVTVQYFVFGKVLPPVDYFLGKFKSNLPQNINKPKI